ncbi:MAG: GSCFA domain-containing protein [Dysgonomonas sp.]
MQFRTKIDIPKSELSIDHQMKTMLFGSCFSENIGNRLIDNKFYVNKNPFGIIYNPSSISKVIRRIIVGEKFTENDLFYHNHLYGSFLHHGSFSDTDKDCCLQNINASLDKAHSDLSDADLLIITFGTAYAYRLKDTKKIVSNCHKFPASEFERERLNIDDIVNDWSLLIQNLRTINPNIKFLFTVSPIRHWKDGAHENQLSKSLLLLSIDRLEKTFGDAYYFPSYEIMMDELRDYRFYAEDMLHPNDVALEYIWKLFQDAYFTDQTKSIGKEWSAIRKAIDHKPFNKDTELHKQFLRQTLLRAETFQNKYPYIHCEKEISVLQEQLK